MPFWIRRLHARASVVAALCVFSALVGLPRVATGEESFTEVGVDFGAGARFTMGTGPQLDLEVNSTIELFRLRSKGYHSYGLELSYSGSDAFELFAVMPRIELGLTRPRFSPRVPGHAASGWFSYLALSGGYGSGTVWDTEYIELYGSEEAVEVDVSGVPLYAALGMRRVGVFSLRIEVVGGVFLVTKEEADMPEGDAPSLIPSIGVRFAFGGDSFSYTWM